MHYDIYNSALSEYKSIFGAMRNGETCTFSIKVPIGTVYDDYPVMVVYSDEKKEYITMYETYQNEFYVNYSCTFKPKKIGVYRYFFALVHDGIRFFIKKTRWALGDFFGTDDFQLTVYSEDYETPKCLEGGIIYQIFPDRFNKSGKSHKNVPDDRIMKAWDDRPDFKPDEFGRVWNNDYFGGDLLGIKEKLPYLKSLGVTCIYLNPIFEAHENHRYNTANYLKIDPLLGTNKDFKDLCKAAKKLGISILLDGVFSHTGADSIYFNKFSRYKSVGAFQSKKSKFYDWYNFKEFPYEYESWWGVKTLPNVDETNPSFMDFICGEKGVLEYWLNMGADGFRLDVADELPDKFLDKLCERVKAVGKDKVIIGEVWEDASNKVSYGIKRKYLLGNQLDGVMNYPFRNAIIKFMKDGNSFDLRESVMTIVENYPAPSLRCLMNFLSTHDIKRVLTELGGDSSDGKNKEWQSTHVMTEAQYNYAKEMFKCAMVIQYFLPGIPSIYYGDEAGLQGYGDPFNRLCYPWGKEDNELIEYTRLLGKLRGKYGKEFSSSPEFIYYGGNGDGFVSFLVKNKENSKALIVSVNIGENERSFSLPEELLEKIESVCVECGKYGDGKIITDRKKASIILANFIK